MGEETNITELMPDLSSLATSLYGTNTDLSFVTRTTGRGEYENEMRNLLRCEFGLVQDPISGIWIQLLSGFVRMEHDVLLEN